MSAKRSRIKYQLGQAYFETLMCLTVVFAFLVGAQYLWRSAELAQMAVEGVRFAAWERTVWEPSDNDTEVYALHKTDEQLGKDVVMRQLSMPAAWRNFRANLSSAGTPGDVSNVERLNFLHPSAQQFVTPNHNPIDMVQITTTSGWNSGLPIQTDFMGIPVDGSVGDLQQNILDLRGGDPTFGKITSLNLDKRTWRTARMKLKTDYKLTVFRSKYRWKPEAGLTEKRLSLITNSWAASPPVSFVRERQLMPFSTSDSVSGFAGNNLGNYTRHIWSILGGPNGFGGQYLSRQIGINAAQVTDMAYSLGQNFDIDLSDRIRDNLLGVAQSGVTSALPGLDFDFFNPVSSAGFMAQTQQSEFFNPNAVSQWHHKHTFVIAEDADSKGEPGKKAANSNIGKRKYRAISAQNPVDTYFTR